MFGCSVTFRPGQKKAVFQPGSEAFNGTLQMVVGVIVRMAATFQRRRVVKSLPRVGAGGCLDEPLEAFPVPVCARPSCI